MKNEEKMGLKKAWGYNCRGVKEYWRINPRIIWVIFLEGLFGAAVPYAGIWLSARFIDELTGGRKPERLWGLAAAVLFTELVLNGCYQGIKHWKNYHMAGLHKMDDQIYMKKFLDLDYPDMDNQHTHDIYSQSTQNRNWAGWGTENTIECMQYLVNGGFQIAGGMALSVTAFTKKVQPGSSMEFLNNPFLIFLMVLLMLGITTLAPFCMQKIQVYWTRYAENVRLGNRIFNYFGYVVPTDEKRAMDIRIYQETRMVLHYLSESMGIFNNDLLKKWKKGAMGIWSGLANASGMLLIGEAYLFVCLKAWGGAFGVGAVTQYVGAITKLFLGISVLMQGIARMQGNGVFLETSYEFLDIPNNMYQGSLTTEKRSDRQYEIEFKDVSFRYPGSSDWALRHVDMKFRVGQRLAVVGENGSGKTTFIKLLCRLYDPQEGEILLNGINIRKYRYDDYMALFSVVFQDFWLLPETLGENVAGTAEYDRSRAEQCLKEAGFEERLQKMPKGLDTHLYKTFDKDGVEVSGGEAQKIAIARALYHDKPFIVLDEPTAALDPVAEAEIYSKFNEIAGDKTAVYISHRLSSCKFCDEIAVFDKGQVVQKGSHEELLKDEEGKYHALWNAQAQYYVEKEA